jgi:cell fate (sporulation/competence/biofilm development) regulator YmcA (YheA/YmcA/DUF963 family)
MKFLNDFLNRRKQKKIRKKITMLQEQAVQHQRNGNLRDFADVTAQIAELEDSINE